MHQRSNRTGLLTFGAITFTTALLFFMLVSSHFNRVAPGFLNSHQFELWAAFRESVCPSCHQPVLHRQRQILSGRRNICELGNFDIQEL